MQCNTKSSFPKISELIEQASTYLVTQGYSQSAIKQHVGIWSKLQEFARLHGDEFFSLELAAKFMKEIFNVNDIYKPDIKTERWRVRYVWCLDDFSKTGCFVRHREYHIAPVPEVFMGIYSLYGEYLNNKKQKPRSISAKLSRVKIFLLFLHQNGITRAKDVSPTTVIEFMRNLNCSTAYRGNILVTLRDFLRCPAFSRLFQEGLADILTTIYSNRYERLPSVYSNEEVSRILSAVDRNTPQGKKDYAIMILAAELGLRVSDIRKLQLDEIKWDKHTIEFFQRKTGEYVQLHMTDNVKWALLDYLMNARPKDSKSNHVFLRSKAPYLPYGEAATFYERINKYISLAGIEIKGKHHGLHSFRHGLASRLMNEGVPITVVSEALGHKFANVTKDYIRIDISRLRLVALEVPSHA